MRTKRFCQSILIIAIWLLIALIAQPVAFAAGSVEFHKINSKILAAAGLPAEHELSVYLPPGYATSQMAYPMVYLLHGLGATNRRFFGAILNIPLNADSLIEQGKMNPMILVGPNITDWIRNPSPWADYVFQEIIPYVERTFRVIPHRTHRALSGSSKGGSDALELAFMRPDLFSVVGCYAAAIVPTNLEQLTKNYDASKYPLRFWIWHGRNDTVIPFATAEKLVEFLKGNGWEYVFESDDGTHSVKASNVETSLQYFSKMLGSPQVSVQPRGKLATTWGKMKGSR